MSTAWSFTRLQQFENCPKAYFHKYVAKDVPDVQSEAMIWGDTVHKALEARVKYGTPLPEGMGQYEVYAKAILNAPGDVITEQRLALNKKLEPTDWFAPDVWVRGIVDVGKIKEDKAILWDYKTGAVKPDFTQLDLFSAMLFIHHPKLQQVRTTYVWLKFNKLSPKEQMRAHTHLVWANLLPRAERMEKAVEANNLPPRPSGLCGWCPVTGCPHHRQR